MRLGLLLCVLIHCIYNHVFARVKIDLRFLRYANRYGRLYGGGKCEGATTGCDTYFKLCVVYPVTSSPSSSSSCRYSNNNYPDIESNYIDFQTQNTGIKKTISLLSFSWSGKIGFYMEIKDDDYLSDDDLIDQHTYTMTLNAGINGSVNSNSYTSYGSRPLYKTTLTFDLKVKCYTYYYGNDCSKYCKYTDDSTGHYKCNNNGERICLNGWFNKLNCLTYCVPNDDDINGHYTCNSTGSRVCRNNWYNLPKCLKRCVPHNDDINGHFSCNSTGERVCLKNYYNLPNCTTFCKPENDTVNGHYTCSDTGKRICYDGWHGSKCTVYCKPRDDATAHYNCSRTGEKICHNDWYGNGCEKYCKANRNDSLGYYICSKNGDKLCMENYYGENCTKFCLVSNNTDSGEHFICDEKTGEKTCQARWVGRYCNISVIISSVSSEYELKTTAFAFSTDLIWSTPSLSSTVYSSSSSTVGKAPTKTSSNIKIATTSFMTSSLVMDSSYYVTNTLTKASSSKFSTIITPIIKRTSTVMKTYTTNSISTRITQSKKSTTSKLLPVKTSIQPSKSSYASSQLKTKVIDKTKKGKTKNEDVNWLLQTDNGKIVLGGSAFALFLLIALAVAVVMYLRLPKKTQPAKKKYTKEFDDTDDFNVEDLMQNAHVNPLYEDDPVSIEKQITLELVNKKKNRLSKKHDVFYEKPLEDESKNDDAITEQDHLNFGVIQNPLYGVSMNHRYDETGV